MIEYFFNLPWHYDATIQKLWTCSVCLSQLKILPQKVDSKRRSTFLAVLTKLWYSHFSFFNLLFNYSCARFPSLLAPALPTPHLPPSILPLTPTIVFVPGSCIHVPCLDNNFLKYHPPVGYSLPKVQLINIHFAIQRQVFAMKCSERVTVCVKIHFLTSGFKSLVASLQDGHHQFLLSL